MPVRTMPCGDVFHHDVERLIVDTAVPIAGLEPSRHRQPVLQVDDARFTLLSAVPHGARTRYHLTAEVAGLYTVPGPTVVYDPDRHLTRRLERRNDAVAFAVRLVLLPLWPVLGFLPQAVKTRLAVFGIDPTVSTAVSMQVEYLLAWVSAGAFLLSVGSGSLPGILTMLALALSVQFDVLYRLSGLYSEPPEQRGFFTWLPKGLLWIVRRGRGPATAAGDRQASPRPRERP